MTIKQIGDIHLNTSVYVSDPHYDAVTWCQSLVNNVKPGKYHCGLTFKKVNYGSISESKVSNLIITHENYADSFSNNQLSSSIIGVDSGLAGIFDKDYFEKYSPSVEKEPWFCNVCKEIENKESIIKDNCCVISRTGYGDGMYKLYVRKNSNDEIISLRIQYI